jgi:hypothetical protein
MAVRDGENKNRRRNSDREDKMDENVVTHEITPVRTFLQ